MSLDEILNKLQEHHQRATFGAVGGVVGVPYCFVMQGRPRNHLTSWVVNRNAHILPHCTHDKQHPNLEEHAHIIDTPEELLEWLEAHP